MTRIKYRQLPNTAYLLTTNNFSTRTHGDLIYAAINLETFDILIFGEDVPRNSSGLSNHVPLERVSSTSLNDSKKKLKSFLIKSGVTFNVEARNRAK